MKTDTTGVGIREIDVGDPPTRFARGWHCLGPVEDFLDGEPHAINAFGTKLVVFADPQSDGTPNVLDAYCRHMGGDLSQGTIKDGAVACPVHDWRWSGDGRCQQVPYAKRTSRFARTRSWTTDVRGGLLFVWHDPEGNPPPPQLQIPDIPEAYGDTWTEWRVLVLRQGWEVPPLCTDAVDATPRRRFAAAGPPALRHPDREGADLRYRAESWQCPASAYNDAVRRAGHSTTPTRLGRSRLRGRGRAASARPAAETRTATANRLSPRRRPAPRRPRRTG